MIRKRSVKRGSKIELNYKPRRNRRESNMEDISHGKDGIKSGVHSHAYAMGNLAENPDYFSPYYSYNYV